MRRILGWVGCLLVLGSGATACGGRSLLEAEGTDEGVDDSTDDNTSTTSVQSGADPAPTAGGRCATTTDDFTSSTGPGRTGSGTGPGTDDGSTSGTAGTVTDNTHTQTSPTNSVTTSGITSADRTDSTVAPTPSGVWVLVRSGAPDEPTEIWDYDEEGRLVYQRQSQASRTHGQYAMHHTLTYGDDAIVRVVHADVVESAIESTLDYVETYDFEAGLLRSLTHAGTTYSGEDSTTTIHYDYDANGRLVQIQEVSSSQTNTQILERREDGVPFRLFLNDVLKCTYNWRLSWYGTECYDEDGNVSQHFQPTADKQLGWFTNSAGTNEFEYDAHGRLTAAFGTRYEYDAVGRLVSSRDDSQVTHLLYDDLGLLYREELESAVGHYVTDFTYERTADNEVTQRAVRGRSVVAHTYRWMERAPQPEPTELSFSEEMRMTYPKIYQHPVDYSVVE